VSYKVRLLEDYIQGFMYCSGVRESRRSPVVDEDRLRPVGDSPWLGLVLFVSFSASTLLVG